MIQHNLSAGRPEVVGPKDSVLSLGLVGGPVTVVISTSQGRRRLIDKGISQERCQCHRGKYLLKTPNRDLVSYRRLALRTEDYNKRIVKTVPYAVKDEYELHTTPTVVVWRSRMSA